VRDGVQVRYRFPGFVPSAGPGDPSSPVAAPGRTGPGPRRHWRAWPRARDAVRRVDRDSGDPQPPRRSDGGRRAVSPRPG